MVDQYRDLSRSPGIGFRQSDCDPGARDDEDQGRPPRSPRLLDHSQGRGRADEPGPARAWSPLLRVDTARTGAADVHPAVRELLEAQVLVLNNDPVLRRSVRVPRCSRSSPASWSRRSSRGWGPADPATRADVVVSLSAVGFFGTFLARAVTVLVHGHRIRDPANVSTRMSGRLTRLTRLERGDWVEEEIQAVD